MTTAVGTSTWLIQLSDVNPQTACIAEMVVAREVLLNWAQAHLAVAGSSTRPSSAMPKKSAPIRCSIGFHRRAAAIAGTASAAICSAGDPQALAAVEHNTRPDSNDACRRYS